jgi:hypothetical protein
VLINQLATPGLGSLLAGRWVAGIGQLLLALVGFVMVVAWFGVLMLQLYRQINGDPQPKSVAWLGEAGAVTFIASWLWAWVTSLSLLRETKDSQDQPPPPLIPRA